MIQTTFNSNQRLFGTDGIRGTVNKDKVTALMAVNLAMAAGEYFYGRAGTKRSRVLIGKDTRVSGYMLESALQAGFIASGVNVRLLGPLPTPGVAYLTKSLRDQFGIVISASHNLFHDNGIKIFSEDGVKISKDFEKKGLIFSALSPDGTLPEIIELDNHPWFVGVQFHPEFKSRPFTPHPLFSSFIKAANLRRRIN